MLSGVRPDDSKPVQPTVYVLNADWIPEARKVQLGISDGEAVILSESRGRQ